MVCGIKSSANDFCICTRNAAKRIPIPIANVPAMHFDNFPDFSNYCRNHAIVFQLNILKMASFFVVILKLSIIHIISTSVRYVPCGDDGDVYRIIWLKCCLICHDKRHTMDELFTTVNASVVVYSFLGGILFRAILLQFSLFSFSSAKDIRCLLLRCSGLWLCRLLKMMWP